MPRRRRFFARANADAEQRPRRRWLRGILFGLAGLLPLLAFIAAGVLWLTVPWDNQTLRIPGLSAPVTVILDGNGVPRIRAANERDAAAALGYVHARDRMFQMDLVRRLASGRLAALLGPDALPIDKQMRVLGLGHLAEGDLAAQSPETRAMLDAYAAGVNAWIASRGRFASLEFLFLGAPEPWRPTDSLLWGRWMGLWLSSNYRTELSRQSLRDKVPLTTLEQLWPTHPPPPSPRAALARDERHAEVTPDRSAVSPAKPDAQGVATPGADAAIRLSAAEAARLLAALPAFPARFTLPSTASDAWAVDGNHTDTGAPMLAGDPHLSFDFPGIWYLARIETPNRVLAGATAPGVPFLVMGRDSQIAWTFTTTGADTQDVYLEPANVAVTSHQERIQVRGQPDTTITVRETRHGPVISDLLPGNGPIMAVAMANLKPGDTAATGLYALNHAATVEDAGKAAPLISSPVQNLLVADRAKIGLFVTGAVPIRRAGDGWAPVPGDASLAALPAPPPSAAFAEAAQTNVASGPASADGDTGAGAAQPGVSPTTAGTTRAASDDPYGWTGFASGDALPHVVTPASGRLVNANEPVW